MRGYPQANRPEQQCRFTLNIEEASARRVQAKSKLEHAKSFGKLGLVRLVLPRFETPPVECPLPVLAAGASGDDQPRLGRGAGSWQSKHPREEAGKKVAAVLDAKMAVRANDRVCRVQAADRLRNPGPGIAHDPHVQRGAHHHLRSSALSVRDLRPARGPDAAAALGWRRQGSAERLAVLSAGGIMPVRNQTVRRGDEMRKAIAAV